MKKSKGKKAFVTGGTGFTGTHLVQRLLDEGYKVSALDTKRGLFHEELIAAGAEVVLGTVTDLAVVEELMHGADVVFHLAAAFRKVNLPKEKYWDVNVNGTRNVMRAAQSAGVRRVIYCSTCGVHGHVKEPPASEDSPIRPADYYQYTKHEGEKVVTKFNGSGMEVTTLRPAAIYGPGDPERWIHLYKRVQPGWFPMFGNGEATYHPLYVDNLIDAFLLAAERDEAVGQTYLIADEEYYRLNDLVREVGKSINKDVKIVRLPFWPLWGLAWATEFVYRPLRIDPPLFRRRVDWYRQDRAFDISKAKSELGYEPRVGLRAGLRRTADWYQEQGYL